MKVKGGAGRKENRQAWREKQNDKATKIHDSVPNIDLWCLKIICRIGGCFGWADNTLIVMQANEKKS